MRPSTLVIFDYSGTLSPGAVEFGRPDSLECHLKKSGLAGIGIDTSERYWHKVVKPTWSKASTSSIGFQSSTTRCIGDMGIPDVSTRSIETAVSKFLDAYMDHSNIDKRWQPLLADIQSRPDMLGLIATDHYAEATGAILSHLTTLNIAALPEADAKGQGGPNAFIVANSADIGCLKANRRFWSTLRRTCLSPRFERVILVDDFGLSESDCSGYAETTRIEKRIAATRQALGEVFEITPEIIHFTLGENQAEAIADTIRTVREMLAL